MREYSLVEQFALVALNGQDCSHNTRAKAAAVYGIKAADMLQRLYLEETDKDILNFEKQLRDGTALVRTMSSEERRSMEKEIADILIAEGGLSEIPNLLGCDLNYYTAEVTMREYKCEETLYNSITEGLKAVVLEPGEVPLEAVSLLWLFRESGCIHDIFSQEEQRQIEERMVKLSIENPLYSIIWKQEFHSGIIQGYLNFLNFKSKLFKNPYLEGLNLLFPFFDRRKSIFIDMVILGTTVRSRRETAIDFLREQGHTCEELVVGSETILKIDNGYYRIWPTTRVGYRLPIQGVALLPVYRI